MTSEQPKRTPLRYRPQRDNAGMITLHRVREDGSLDPNPARPTGERLADLQRQIDAMKQAVTSARKVERVPPTF